MNRVQFQPGLSLPRCQHVGASRFQRGTQWLWQCPACLAQTSLTASTLLADTKLPLRTWWLASYLICQAKNGISALELMRQLGVCYRTAWRMKHKLMAAMADSEASRQLSELVQLDDAYLGGEHRRNATHSRLTTPISSRYPAYWARQGTIIEPTPALVEMLRLTDITREIPASLLRMPFPALYFHGQLLQPERDSNIEALSCSSIWMTESVVSRLSRSEEPQKTPCGSMSWS